jgi:hypothetical protein
VLHRHRHADGGGEALPERTGRGLDARGVPELRVSGGLRAEAPEGTEVVDLESVPGEEELRVEQDAGVPARQDEPVPADPGGVGRVVADVSLEEQVGDRGERDGRPRMPGSGRFDGVEGEETGGGDRAVVEWGHRFS